MLKKIILVTAIIGVLAISSYLIYSPKNQEYEVINPLQGTIQEHVKSSGNLQPSGITKLYANSTGVIKKLYVANGDLVVKGQPIADIESTATEIQIAQAKANYQIALNGIKSAKQNKTLLQSQLEAARKTVLDTANSVNTLDDRLSTNKINPTTGKEYTQEEIDSIRSSLTSARQLFQVAESQFKEADGQIVAAQAALDLAKLNLDATKDTTLKATADGTIVNLGLIEGDTVQAGAENLTAQVPPLASIVDLSSYTIKVEVNETRVKNIKPGQIANIIFDSSPEQQFNGIVRAKDTIGTNIQGLVSYYVYITPGYLPENIKPGMTANVEIITEQKDNVLIIPSEVLQKEANKTFVNTLDANNQIIKKEITVGISNDGLVEVVSGITQEDKLVLPSTAK